MTSLIIYAYCGPLWHGSNKPHETGFVISYVSGSIHYAIQQLSPHAWLHCIHQGLHTPRDSSKKESGQVTSVAKQPDPATQSNGFENVDWEMQVPAYQNKGVCHLATATAIDWCGEEHILTTLAAHLPGNRLVLRCQALFKYKWPDELVSKKNCTKC
jgi:hypothetical protein